MVVTLAIKSNFRILGYCFLIDRCSNITHYIDMKFRIYFADILMFTMLKNFNEIDTPEISEFYKFNFLRF